MAQEINSNMDWYMSWIAQLVRALAREAKGRVQVSVQDRIFLFKF